MKRYAVELTRGARRDIDDILDYVASRESVDRALHVADMIEAALASLATFPNRGAHPREMLDLGHREFRQAITGPFRIIYTVVGARVVVLLVADGRRDMRTLLNWRLLGQ